MARVVSAWNGFVAALLFAVVLTGLVLSGFSPTVPVMALCYGAPVAIIVLALVGHRALEPRHSA